MKINFSSTILFLLFMAPNLFGNVTFSGKITDSEGKTLAKSAVWADNQVSGAVICLKNGDYQITIPYEDRVKLNFSGINHDQYSFNFYPEDNKSYNVDVMLGGYNLEKLPEQFSLVGSFNDFSFKSGVIEMHQAPDGTYHATIPGKFDTLKYQILFKIVEPGSETVRTINGTDQDYYEIDNGGDFISCKINSNNNSDISFDPKNLLSKSQPVLKSSSPEINEFRDVVAKVGGFYNRVLYQVKINMPEKTGITFEQLKNQAMDSLKIFSKEKMSPSSLRFFAFEYMNIASIGGLPADKSLIDPKMPEIVLTGFSPMSSLWDRYYNVPIECEKYRDNMYNSTYIDSMLKYNPSADAREFSYYNIIRYTLEKKDTAKMKEYYEQLKKDFPNGRAARDLNLTYNIDGSRKIIAGKQIPEFKLVSLDNDKDSISIGNFKGKYVLIDVWGTWCMPCVNEMEHLHKIYEKYKGKNFTLYSIGYDSSPEIIQTFRAKKWKMPWSNAFMSDGVKNPAYNLLEITGFPTPILIDPDGKILAVNSDARGEKLDKLLSDLMGE